MNLATILKQSFETLKARPIFFIPKIISSSISSIWIIIFLSQSLSKEIIVLYLITYPFLVILGVFVSILVAKMVEIKDQEEILKQSIFFTIKRYKEVLKTTIGLLFVSLIIALPSVAGTFIFSLTFNLIYLVSGFILSFLGILLLSFFIFFLPISLIEKGTIRESLRDSARTSLTQYKEVIILLSLSFTLLALSSLTQGILREIGFIGFFIGRLISTIVTTYLFVVSPTFYLEES